ncbi:MAG: GNAT family N-acetyltransferase [Micromonosporaceae bacterium]
MSAVIRASRPSDRADLYRICLQTGDSGQDASHLYQDADLLGHVYVGPYLALQPELAYVLVDAEGVAGYVLGVRGTRDFEARAEREWWPSLRRRYPADGQPDPGRLPGARDQRLIHLIHEPPRAPVSVIRDFPSHLHIDLAPRCQGAGHGRRLMTTLFEALRERGSTGVHLGVGRRNRRAIGFYGRLGFTELDSDDSSLVLGLPL